MKKLFLIWILSSTSIFAYTQTKWDGGGDGLSWSDALNWVGDIVPGPSDNVLLDNSIVPGTYTVNLPPGVVVITINSLIISPTLPSTITLLLPASNMANPGLNITGSGDALILNQNAVLKNASGASTGGGLNI